MHDKSTRFTLAVTAGFILTLVLVGWILNRRAIEKGEDRRPTAADRSGPPADPPPDAVPASDTAGVAPALPTGPDRQPTVDYQVITRCSLADDPDNDGDTFLITTPDGPFRFTLYGVDAVETNGGDAGSAARIAEYFDLTTEEQIRKLSAEASDFSLRLLKSCKFRVATRWEKDPGDDAYLAFLFLDDGENGSINLSMYLAQFGLAAIRTPDDPLPVLPDGTEPGEFILQLQTAEKNARSEGHGAWSSRAAE